MIGREDETPCADDFGWQNEAGNCDCRIRIYSMVAHRRISCGSQPFAASGARTGKRCGREIRLDRPTLFERVWSEPVEKLAKGWGLSRRGLAKASHRLKIPVLPRGFWARVQHGQRMRRARLPALPPGEAKEIVIRSPK